MGVETIGIDHIRRDGGTQMRVATNEEAAQSYAERLEAGDRFPPIVVFFDGAAHWLADGFHRVEAHGRLRSKHIGTSEEQRWAAVDADVRSGGIQDAIWFAVSANKLNGLRRTNADKQVAVRAALAHPNSASMSDQAIADVAGVSKEMIRRVREVTTVVTCAQPSATATKSATQPPNTKRTGKDGKSYPKKKTPSKSGPAKTRSKEQQREHDRQRMADKRAAQKQATAASAVTKQVCPHCNGKGYIE